MILVNKKVSTQFKQNGVRDSIPEIAKHLQFLFDGKEASFEDNKKSLCYLTKKCQLLIVPIGCGIFINEKFIKLNALHIARYINNKLDKNYRSQDFITKTKNFLNCVNQQKSDLEQKKYSLSNSQKSILNDSTEVRYTALYKSTNQTYYKFYDFSEFNIPTEQKILFEILTTKDITTNGQANFFAKGLHDKNLDKKENVEKYESLPKLNAAHSFLQKNKKNDGLQKEIFAIAAILDSANTKLGTYTAKVTKAKLNLTKLRECTERMTQLGTEVYGSVAACSKKNKSIENSHTIITAINTNWNNLEGDEKLETRKEIEIYLRDLNQSEHTHSDLGKVNAEFETCKKTLSTAIKDALTIALDENIKEYNGFIKSRLIKKYNGHREYMGSNHQEYGTKQFLSLRSMINITVSRHDGSSFTEIIKKYTPESSIFNFSKFKGYLDELKYSVEIYSTSLAKQNKLLEECNKGLHAKNPYLLFKKNNDSLQKL